MLGACGGSHTHRTATHYNPTRYYPPPGPGNDPWGPYIHEASGRFGVPELWIRRVMRQESGGQEDVISWAGAMGLMQVMPETYDGLRGRYNLGDDPFDPHNNILAGTAYLREMYDRFGSPGFLAAYNAGPNRLDRYLNNGTPLPAETVNYVASLAPLLGPGTPMSGPLAVYARGGSYAPRLAARRTPSGCDPDAAFNPDGPCTPLAPAVVQAVAVAPAQQATADCDADAAYDPTHPCRPLPAAPMAVQAPVVAQAIEPPPVRPFTRTAQQATSGCDPDAAYDPTRRCRPLPPMPAQALSIQAPMVAQAIEPPSSRTTIRTAAEARPIQERMGQPVMVSARSSVGQRMAQPVAFAAGPPPGHWKVQVGAFATLSTAQAAAEKARSAAPDLLATAKVELPATTPFGTQVAFRARLGGLSAAAAAEACSRLASRGTACITVPPPRDAF